MSSRFQEIVERTVDADAHDVGFMGQVAPLLHGLFGQYYHITCQDPIRRINQHDLPSN